MEELKTEPASLVIRGDFKQIELTRGKVTFVSPEDYEWLSQYSWRASIHSRPGCAEKWYAKGWVDGVDTYMHRLVTGCPRGLVADHKDGNGLNNTRQNLRTVTQMINTAHTRFQKKEACEPFL